MEEQDRSSFFNLPLPLPVISKIQIYGIDISHQQKIYTYITITRYNKKQIYNNYKILKYYEIINKFKIY